MEKMVKSYEFVMLNIAIQKRDIKQQNCKHSLQCPPKQVLSFLQNVNCTHHGCGAHLSRGQDFIQQNTLLVLVFS